MKHFLLVGICSISILSSCNLKPITYEVNIVSNTLTIDNKIAAENRDYEATISLIDSTKDYRLPTLVTITISGKTLISGTDYTYNFDSGKLKINANVITNKVTITGEGEPLDFYSVNMSSSTLSISNTNAIENRNYNGIITFVGSFEDYRLPTLVTVIINERTLTDEDYSYNCGNGEIKINGNVIKGDITIVGERTELDAYRANFICDEHARVYIYKNRNYDVDPVKSNIAYSRDKDSGIRIKDGTGETNFKIEIDANYDIDRLWVRGLYDKCQDNEKTKAEDVYRITKIRGDLEIKISTKKIYCKKFAASDNLVNNSFSFSWATRESKNVDHIHINVTATGYSNSFDIEENNFTFTNAEENKVYIFTFTPYLDNGVIGSPYECTRSIIKSPLSIAFPRIEIETENYELTEMKRPVSNYIQNIVKIYSKQNNLVYDSSENLSEKEKYEGSKIKIRGNATALFNKKPYKIKLKNDADLLESFRDDSNPSINYSNKDWLLLCPNTNNQLGEHLYKANSEIYHTPIGFAVADALGFDWKPSYQFVNLYYNNDYQGLYILCEPTSRGNGFDEEQSRYKIDEDGFIVEKDYYWAYEDMNIDTPINNDGEERFTFKYPDTDNFNCESKEYNYIKDYLVLLENLILNYDSSCFNLIDKQSLVRWLLAQDILANEDPIGSNIFLYKKNMENNTILSMGTIWDFGLSMKNPDKLAPIRTHKNFYYPWLLKMPNFEQEVKTMYFNVKQIVIAKINNYLDSIDNDLYDNLLTIESKRWDFELINLSTQKDYIESFFINHFSFLDEQFN